jgi:hypothetical protein
MHEDALRGIPPRFIEVQLQGKTFEGKVGDF